MSRFYDNVITSEAVANINNYLSVELFIQFTAMFSSFGSVFTYQDFRIPISLLARDTALQPSSLYCLNLFGVLVGKQRKLVPPLFND